jgi:putative membrane protein
MMSISLWYSGLTLILLLVGAVAIGYAVSRRSDRPTPRAEDSEELLRRRYAAGEINDEEYRRRLTALRTTDRVAMSQRSERIAQLRADETRVSKRSGETR